MSYSFGAVFRELISTQLQGRRTTFLSLISGRNAELLIGKHVITAPFLR